MVFEKNFPRYDKSYCENYFFTSELYALILFTF